MDMPTFSLYGDVLVTAVEGGIGYWAEVKSYKWRSGDVECQIREIDAENQASGYWHIMTEKDISRAMHRIASRKVETNPYIVKEIAGALANKDAGDIDSELADVVVQVALFDEIKYG